MNVNKTDLVRSLAGTTGTTLAQAGKGVDALFDLIAGAVSEGGKVRIGGFGTFSEKVRAPRTGRNPRTGEPVEIPETRTISFKPSRKST